MGNSLISASQKLLSGLSTKFTGDPYIAEAAVLVPSQFRDGAGTPNWFFGPNGVDYRFVYSDLLSASDGYQRCPPLAAVINRKAQAYINGRTQIMNSRGKEATDPLAKKIRTLLAKPNPLQSWRQFEAQQKMYIDLFGFCIMMPLYSYGFQSLGPTAASSLWNMPSYLISAKENLTKAWFNAAKLSDIVPEIRLKYGSLNISLPTDDLYIFKDFVPNFSSQVFPDSRVKALAMPVNNIISAYESRNELINYAGSQGILTPETDQAGVIPLKDGEKEQIQADFKRQYGIKKGQSRYIISPAALKWQPMGKATRDLMLFEEIADDIMRICDGYGYPSPLLNSEKGPSVSNTEQYKKQIYEDTIIPESLDIYEQWNAFFRLEESNITIIKTYDHLPILQQDQVLEGQARLYLNQACLIEYQNNLITLNQWREQQGIDTVPGDDIYYYEAIQQGRTAIPVSANNQSQNQNQDNETEDAQ